jgi:hypothetical protein
LESAWALAATADLPCSAVPREPVTGQRSGSVETVAPREALPLADARSPGPSPPRTPHCQRRWLAATKRPRSRWTPQRGRGPARPWPLRHQVPVDRALGGVLRIVPLRDNCCPQTPVGAHYLRDFLRRDVAADGFKSPSSHFPAPHRVPLLADSEPALRNLRAEWKRWFCRPRQFTGAFEIVPVRHNS